MMSKITKQNQSNNHNYHSYDIVATDKEDQKK